jgi:hypothetical protein
VTTTEVARLERFFSAAAGLEVDSEDLARFGEFVGQRIDDLLLVARGTARANNRDIIAPQDLPISRGLQDCIRAFREIELGEAHLLPILERILARPPRGIEFTEEVRDRLVLIVGGLSVALARAPQILEPGLTAPRTMDWERVFRLFNLVV